MTIENPPKLWTSATEDQGGRVNYSTSTEREHVLDGAVRDAWQHCVPARDIVYVPGRAVFHGPWIDWSEIYAARKRRAEKKAAASLVLASQQGAL